ncbi:winged helix-turn-helix domain-containing protein [Dyella acidisoli]|uniref:OmpR/PhoB-type domain-containing protein n=1 Tax=Dyella acidisoli TaxID=1867834 RepID=A0ABQ5XIR5_9GAMM|nr:winged helix-turn-helix domain-containing protein [Dyella acidisoli]GLQ91600.1 hypothetical protein GCM10007901_05500 [Dyella acidisoli]
MGNLVYCFDDFRLDPLARELTRNGSPIVLPASTFDCLVYLIENRARAVGKDELIAAVWGRADVSDNLLAQTIVRLRRSLSDAGHEQRCIKTVPRVGYRWALDTVVEFQTTGAVSAQGQVTEPLIALGPRNSASSPKWLRPPSLLIALLLTIVAATGYGVLQYQRNKPASPVQRFDHNLAIVLPATVNGPEDWKWLQLGLMELISNHLRIAAIPTESSQNVLRLLKQANKEHGDSLASSALIISPRVTLTGTTWHVHLDAKVRNGQNWQAESSSTSVLDAAHAASDMLLAQLGYGAVSMRHGGDPQQEYLLRIDAAHLANRSDLARTLIDQAPPAVRRMPEFVYAEANVHCKQGDLARCKQGLTDLLQQLPADKKPLLRAKVLTSLWYSYYQERQFAQGEAALSEAIRLLQGQKDAEALATAYLDRSHLEFFDGKLEEAAGDLGLARVNYTLAGDSAGPSKADVAMAMIAMQRGQFVQALQLQQQAYEQYQRLGLRELLSLPLQGLAYSHKMLLQFPEELAVTDRYWPFEQKNLQFYDDYVRRDMTILRAIALADNGRTSEASAVLEQLSTQFKTDDKPAQRAWVEALLAKLALERGDTRVALSWIAKAMEGSALTQDEDKRHYAEAWLIHINILLRAGKLDELKHSVAAMQTWATPLKEQDDWIKLYLVRATAAEAWSQDQHQQALDQLKLAMAQADRLGVPELIVSVGQSYAQALLNSGNVDPAVAVSGRLSNWSQLDWRAAWTEACVYKALGQMPAWEKSRSKAQELAGDRQPLTESAVLGF